MKDNELVMCGTVLSKATYDKAQNICKKHNTNLEEFINSLIHSLVKGELKIQGNKHKY